MATKIRAKGESSLTAVRLKRDPPVHGHRFKIYTLVSEIHENIDIVLGIKNVFELEGVINS